MSTTTWDQGNSPGCDSKSRLHGKTQEIGLFALAASRVGAQRSPTSPTLVKILWLLVSRQIFCLWVYFHSIFEPHNGGGHFGFSGLSTSGSAVQQRLCPSCSFWTAVGLQTPEKGFGSHPKQLPKSPTSPNCMVDDGWNILKHILKLEISSRWCWSLWRQSRLRAQLHPLRLGLGAITTMMARDPGFLGRLGPALKSAVFLLLFYSRIPQIAMKKPMNRYEPVLNNWADWGWWSLALQMHKLRKWFCNILHLHMCCEWRFAAPENDLNAVTSCVRDHPNVGVSRVVTWRITTLSNWLATGVVNGIYIYIV